MVREMNTNDNKSKKIPIVSASPVRGCVDCGGRCHNGLHGRVVVVVAPLLLLLLLLTIDGHGRDHVLLLGRPVHSLALGHWKRRKKSRESKQL